MMNSADTEPKRGPGRPRKEEVRERRRKRSGSAYQHEGRMGVNPDLLNHNQFAYRWINDEQNARLVVKTKHDDWQVLSQDGGEIKEDATDLGNAISIVVGAHKDGSPKRAYLCRKPKDWFEEDQMARQAELDEQLVQLRRGNDGVNQSDYVPSGVDIR